MCVCVCVCVCVRTLRKYTKYMRSISVQTITFIFELIPLGRI